MLDSQVAGEAMKVIELKGRDKYVAWTHENDGKYKVIRVAATNLSSSSWTAALGSAFKGERTFTVMYEEKDRRVP
jgi:hypothetical protein